MRNLTKGMVGLSGEKGPGRGDSVLFVPASGSPRAPLGVVVLASMAWPPQSLVSAFVSPALLGSGRCDPARASPCPIGGLVRGNRWREIDPGSCGRACCFAPAVVYEKLSFYGTLSGFGWSVTAVVGCE